MFAGRHRTQPSPVGEGDCTWVTAAARPTLESPFPQQIKVLAVLRRVNTTSPHQEQLCGLEETPVQSSVLPVMPPVRHTAPPPLVRVVWLFWSSFLEMVIKVSANPSMTMSLKKEKWVEKMCPGITFWASIQDHYVKSRERLSDVQRPHHVWRQSPVDLWQKWEPVHWCFLLRTPLKKPGLSIRPHKVEQL